MDKLQSTPLHDAVCNNSINAVKLLLCVYKEKEGRKRKVGMEDGEKVKGNSFKNTLKEELLIQDKNGHTVLHIAAFNGNETIMSTLKSALECGESVRSDTSCKARKVL